MKNINQVKDEYQFKEVLAALDVKRGRFNEWSPEYVRGSIEVQQGKRVIKKWGLFDIYKAALFKDLVGQGYSRGAAGIIINSIDSEDQSLKLILIRQGIGPEGYKFTVVPMPKAHYSEEYEEILMLHSVESTHILKAVADSIANLKYRLTGVKRKEESLEPILELGHYKEMIATYGEWVQTRYINFEGLKKRVNAALLSL